MAKNKTTESAKSVAAFIESVPDQAKRKDTLTIVELMRSHTKFEPKMWGSSIIGFGSYHYTYESGREGDMPLVCFSPRKDSIVLYLSTEFEKREELLQRFGKHRTGKGCIYIKRLEDVDMGVLKEMIIRSVRYRKDHNPS
jgi:hypothetical protein